jgi:hypothetical protein
MSMFTRALAISVVWACLGTTALAGPGGSCKSQRPCPVGSLWNRCSCACAPQLGPLHPPCPVRTTWSPLRCQCVRVLLHPFVPR